MIYPIKLLPHLYLKGKMNECKEEHFGTVLQKSLDELRLYFF